MNRFKAAAGLVLCLGVGFIGCDNGGGDEQKIDGNSATTVGDILKKAPDGGYTFPEVLPDAARALLAMDLRLENLLDAIIVIPPPVVMPDMMAPRAETGTAVDRSPDVTVTIPVLRLDTNAVPVDAVPDGQPAVDRAPQMAVDVADPTPDMTPDVVISLPDMAMMSPPDMSPVDAAPTSDGCTSAAACDDKNPCTVDTCTSGVCGNAVAPMITVCRVAKGACDRAEYCDGTTAVCPVDRFQSAGTICGPPSVDNRSRENAAVYCQSPTCSGSAPQCPPPPACSYYEESPQPQPQGTPDRSL